jgi:hypothetical protein
MALPAFALAASLAAPAASASQIVSTSTVSALTLGVNGKGQAMVSYRSGGHEVHVLAWGAVNAVQATPIQRNAALQVTGIPTQVKFHLAYDGGYRLESGRRQAELRHLRDLQQELEQATAAGNNPLRWALGPRIRAAYAKLASLRNAATNYWRTFSCPGYDGPRLADLVAACKAPDGSYWAVQSWDRDLPDYGLPPNATETQMEVHLSHWTGPLPILAVHADWGYHGRWQHLWGTYTYLGSGIHGYHSTPQGVPLDLFGRNLYLDTYDSIYGPGWRRENSFLTHNPRGSWCYSVNPHGGHPAGVGTHYRLTILGLGVTPDVSVVVTAPAPYNRRTQAAANAALRALHDPLCVPH